MESKEVLQTDLEAINKQIKIAEIKAQMAEYNAVGIELQRQKRVAKLTNLQDKKSEISTKLGLLKKEELTRK